MKDQQERNTLDEYLAMFMACSGVDEPGLAAWMGMSVEALSTLARYPALDLDSMALPDECAALASAIGADLKTLQRIVLFFERLRRQGAQLHALPAA